MMAPPMVGVPALCWWVGPSSRITWKSERARRKRIHSGVRNSATRNATPPDSIKLSTSHSPQQFLRHHSIIKGDHLIAPCLGRFVSLGRDHAHVPGSGALYGESDGPPTIALANDLSARHATRHHCIN